MHNQHISEWFNWFWCQPFHLAPIFTNHQTILLAMFFWSLPKHLNPSAKAMPWSPKGRNVTAQWSWRMCRPKEDAHVRFLPKRTNPTYKEKDESLSIQRDKELPIQLGSIQQGTTRQQLCLVLSLILSLFLARSRLSLELTLPMDQYGTLMKANRTHDGSTCWLCL